MNATQAVRIKHQALQKAVMRYFGWVGDLAWAMGYVDLQTCSDKVVSAITADRLANQVPQMPGFARHLVHAWCLQRGQLQETRTLS